MLPIAGIPCAYALVLLLTVIYYVLLAKNNTILWRKWKKGSVLPDDDTNQKNENENEDEDKRSDKEKLKVEPSVTIEKQQGESSVKLSKK